MSLILPNPSNSVPEDKKRYIGIDQPKVTIMIENNVDFPGKLYPSWELETIDGDHLRIDEQPNEPDN